MKKSNQGFSVTKTDTAKTSIAKLVTHETTTNKRSVDMWMKYSKKTEVFEIGVAFKACIDYALVGKVKKDDSGKSKVYLSKDDKKRCGVHKLVDQGYTPNDLTAMTKIGLYYNTNKEACENAVLDAIEDGTPRKPQRIWQVIDPDANAKRPSNTGDIDKWITSVVNSAIKRGLTKQQLVEKIIVACGGKATFKTQSQGTSNVNEILKPSTFKATSKTRKNSKSKKPSTDITELLSSALSR